MEIIASLIMTVVFLAIGGYASVWVLLSLFGNIRLNGNLMTFNGKLVVFSVAASIVAGCFYMIGLLW